MIVKVWIFLLFAGIQITCALESKSTALYDENTIKFLNETGLLLDRQRNSMTKFRNEGVMYVPSTAGIVQSGCEEKKYLVSSAWGTMMDAWHTCATVGMVPAVLESLSEMKCVRDLFKNYATLTNSDLFRVAHLDYSLTRKFEAYPKSTLLPLDMWAKSEPDNYRNEQPCTAFQFAPNFGIFDVPCFQSFRVLCQYEIIEMKTKSITSGSTSQYNTDCGDECDDDIDDDVTTRKTTIQTTKMFKVRGYNTQFLIQVKTIKGRFCNTFDGCPKRRKFSSNGTLEVPANIGKLVEPCGQKQFFFSNQKSMVEQSKHFYSCCDIGGIPAVIENKAELDCLKERYDQLPAKMKTLIYYVSGFDTYLNRTFTSCPGNIPVPNDLWLPNSNEPNNEMGGQSAVVVTFTNITYGLTDEFCLTIFSFICQFTNITKN